MPVRKAEIVAQQLATLCRTSVGIAKSMELQLKNEELLEQVVNACATGIAEIRQRLENALALANGLRAVHDTLLLVTTETAKGPAGMPAIVDNAPALVQQSLSRILALSGAQANPAAIDVGSLLATISQTASLMPLPATPAPQRRQPLPDVRRGFRALHRVAPRHGRIQGRDRHPAAASQDLPRRRRRQAD
jgi:hypothetical protein